MVTCHPLCHDGGQMILNITFVEVQRLIRIKIIWWETQENLEGSHRRGCQNIGCRSCGSLRQESLEGGH